MKFQYNFNKFISDINNSSGISVGELSKEDCKIFQSIVYDQYIEVISNVENSLEKYSEISEYHNSRIANTDLHKQLWPKQNRILSKIRLEQLMKSKFFSELRSQFDWHHITDEENVGFGEVYFRLCRPAPFKDVGPLHADAWFWELGHGEMPKTDFDTQRVKFWFCLETKESKTGFIFVPGSHKKKYNYTGEFRDGFVKPVFNKTDYNLKVESLCGKPGTFVVFNDLLLHGGEALGSGTRVSLEFTLVIHKKLKKTYI